MSTASALNDQNQKATDVVVTLCKNCVFAIRDNVTNNQIGCKYDRLIKYREKGVEVLECVDEKGNYFTINGRICVFCRDSNWFDNFSDNYLEQLNNETRITYDVIILSNRDYVSVKRTLEGLKEQHLLPKKVTVVLEADEEDQSKSLMDYFFENRIFSWKLKYIDTGVIDYGKAIDSIVEIQKSAFYCICNSGYKFRIDLFSELNKRIVHQLEQYPVILPDEDGNGFICQVYLHKLLAGNRGMPLVTKIRKTDWKLPKITSF